VISKIRNQAKHSTIMELSQDRKKTSAREKIAQRATRNADEMISS